MKVILILSAVLALAVTSPLDQARAKEGDVELVEPRTSQRGFGGFDDFRGPAYDDDDMPEIGFRFNPFEGGFGSTGLQDFFEWMRRRMNDAFRPFGRPGFGFGFGGGDEDFGENYPPNYDNSTYTTKVVNGTVVAVNETIRRHKTNNTNFFVHVKVVKLVPQNASDQNPQPADEKKSNASTPIGNDESNDVNTAKRFRRDA